MRDTFQRKANGVCRNIRVSIAAGFAYLISRFRYPHHDAIEQDGVVIVHRIANKQGSIGILPVDAEPLEAQHILKGASPEIGADFIFRAAHSDGLSAGVACAEWPLAYSVTSHKSIVVIELSTLGGDPEVARMMGEDAFGCERNGANKAVRLLGKAAIYSAGVTFMSSSHEKIAI